jgi:lipoprotein-anchoring transpeptidase ErfK/SrfK
VRGPYGAQLVRRTQLRARPGGPVVRSLGIRTGYGSVRVLAVTGRRGRWLAVLTDHLPNSRVGWIPVENVTLLHEPYTLHVDLSARELVVHREGRPVRRITVAVGRPGTTTPIGRFAVTDLLQIDGDHPAYGCCALALTGRQPNVPQGWSGGDRIAIHGTANEATLGTPASSGCLRASDHDMRWLLARIALGTPVRIHA